MTTKEKIIDYIMSTPTNTNWNVLSSMLGDGDWTRLKAYVETTPHNMNRMVLKSLLDSENISKSFMLSLSFNYDTEGAQPIYVTQMASTPISEDIMTFLQPNGSYSITANFASGLTSTTTATLQSISSNQLFFDIKELFNGADSIILGFSSYNDSFVAGGNGSILVSEVSTNPAITYGDNVTFVIKNNVVESAVVGTAVVGRDTVG